MKYRITKYVVGDNVYFQSIEGSILSSVYKEIVSGDFKLIESNGTCYCINNSTKEIFTIANNEFRRTKFRGHNIYEVNSNFILVFNESQNENISTAFKKGEIIWKTNEKRFSTVFSNKYIAYKPKYKTNEVVIKNIETNNTVCQYKFNEDFKVARKLHINGNDLVVSLMKNDFSESRIANISISECSLKWNVKSKSHEHLLNNQKLYGLIGSVPSSKTELEIFDLINGNHECLIIQELEKDIVPWNCTIKAEKLYFSNNHNGCSIGILDLTTNQIINEHKLKLDRGVKLYEPKYINGELFVKDTMNIVHQIKESNHT